MRTYGRGTDGKWYQVNIDVNGKDDDIWLTTMAQVCASELEESPFFPSYGLPARASIVGRTHPDFFISRIREQFSKYFTSISIVKTIDITNNAPTYHIDVQKQNGSAASVTIRT